jgi:uncharacterized membrane protein
MALNVAFQLTKKEYFVFLAQRLQFWRKLRNFLLVYIGLIIVINFPSLLSETLLSGSIISLALSTLLSVSLVAPIFILIQVVALLLVMWEYRQEIGQQKVYLCNQTSLDLQTANLKVEYAWEFFDKLTQDKMAYYLQPKVRSSWSLVMIPKRVFLNVQRRQEFEKLMAQKLS